jgi:hypothetical protein
MTLTSMGPTDVQSGLRLAAKSSLIVLVGEATLLTLKTRVAEIPAAWQPASARVDRMTIVPNFMLQSPNK